MIKSLRKYSPEIFSTVLMMVVFIPLALNRLIARDEGFYTYAASLINQGKTLYLDFFFPQMPLSAHIFAIWSSIFGESWEAFRILNALLTIILGIFLINYIKNKAGNFNAYTTAILFTFSNYVFPWYLATLTYAPSVLLLFLCYLTIQKNDRKNYFAAGMFFSLAFQCRLLFIGLSPVFLIYLFLNNRKDFKKFLTSCGYMLAGFMLTMLPTFFYMIKDFQAFYFDNYGHHLFRASQGEKMLDINQSNLIKTILGLKNAEKYEAFQMPLLIYLSLISAIAILLKKREICLAFMISTALFFINLLPEPTHIQYYAALIPFLLCTIFCNSAYLLPQKFNKYTNILIVIFSLLYLNNVQTDIKSYTETGMGVIGIMNPEEAKHWNVKRTKEISAMLNRHSNPGDQIITFWPGYLLSTHLKPYPGTENHFGIKAADKISKKLAKRYNIISSADTVTAVKNKLSKFVLITRIDLRREDLFEALKVSGYKLLEDNDTVKLYALSENALPPQN